MSYINSADETPAEITGVIQRYFSDIEMGTIKTESHDAYPFKLSEWVGPSVPVSGQRVTFRAKNNQAIKVKPT
jgi:hypothetical protein